MLSILPLHWDPVNILAFVLTVFTGHNLHLLAVYYLNFLLSPDLESDSFFSSCTLRVVKSHVSDQITLVSEASATLRTFMRLFLRRWWHVCWVVIQVLVSLQQLFLSEALITLIALVRFLVCVYQHMGLKVALGYGTVGAKVALKTLFPLVTLLVNLQGVPVRESLPTHLAMHRPLTCVKLLHVKPQVRLSATRCWTKFTLINRLLPRMNGAVGFQAVTLCKSCMADVTFVRLLPCMDTKMSLQLECVWTCISAVWTLVWPFPRVTSHVSL